MIELLSSRCGWEFGFISFRMKSKLLGICSLIEEDY